MITVYTPLKLDVEKEILDHYGALHYDEEHDIYTMSEKEADYWFKVSLYAGSVESLEKSLTIEDLTDYNNMPWDVDILRELTQRRTWLIERLHITDTGGDSNEE